MSATPPPTPSSSSPSSPKPQPSQHAFQAPTGTRDFYPAELNRLRYIQNAWRTTSINHGFEEIDGPTFEHLELYTAKSGEGIVSELFSFERFGGEKTFALRPEFTPTLARMYASKAASLPKPTKWFWQQNCYRAERPQRGRLREFSQWNCDIIGSESNEPEAQARADAECIATCVGALEGCGLTPKDVAVRINHRAAVFGWLEQLRVPSILWESVIALLDKRGDAATPQFTEGLGKLGIDRTAIDALSQPFWDMPLTEALSASDNGPIGPQTEGGLQLRRLCLALQTCGLADWCRVDTSIFRGLAYYTGMVFEVIVDGERAIAGGGRYDKLIETFGGPATPAVGFGMGDVVLSLVLQDKGLMPSDDQIAEKLGLRPDALVIAYEDKNDAPKSAAAEAAIAPTLAALRSANLHARRSYKTTKNVGKLIQDAAKVRARYCVIIESATTAQLKNMDTQEQKPVALSDLPTLIAAR